MGSGGVSCRVSRIPRVLLSAGLILSLWAFGVGARERGASAWCNRRYVHLRRDDLGRACNAGQQEKAERLSAAEYHQVCSARGGRVSDPHILLLTHVCAALCDIQCGCAQVWHEEHIGDCFEAVLDKIATGGHPGDAVHIAADQAFITVLRGVSPATSMLSGAQVSPPPRPVVSMR